MSDFVTRDDVLRAEVLWTLTMNASHFSYQSAEDVGTIFRSMFPDSAIASQFSCGERKANYIMRFGLTPHFKDLLLKSLQEVPAYVLLFDETYNPVTKNKQMDILVRYWTSMNRITSVYVTSVFTGHGQSDDMLQHFLSATAELDLEKALHKI